ncbi:zinc ribbon domain-containing protein [Streptomyces sp. WAC00263]|uniref:zinc ribbon domain-containing protein n=1 Tax=Streptomyces sp. WAC00263 TaxID=1917422 RepID=UPI0015EEB297|nr:zinc ribbon domain-containing protein [Streptomyces sp. WAC00263]KAF5990666.1 transposase [Streptomyces sp. WAC00263]
MSRRMQLAEGETSRTACARAALRTGVDEESGEVLPVMVLVERVGWAADLVSGMVTDLLAGHWNSVDVDVLAAGVDAGGRKLPSNAWMACRRLGWTVAPPEGVKVNDRIVRMAQEQAGRTLRSVKWRADLTGGVIKTWPADPAKRTPEEWTAVRDAVPGGEHLPSSVVKSRTRQVAVFQQKHGRLPVDLFEAEAEPRTARMLLLAACDGQQATIERADEPGRVLLRLQLPTRPDPASYRDWTWVSCPISLPPTVPARAVLHLPAMRLRNGKVHADIPFTHAVPKASSRGHTVALGVDWGLNTLLSAGAVQRGSDGTITALGCGGMFRAAGVLAKQHRLRQYSERLHAKAAQYERLIGGAEDHALTVKHQVLRDEIGRVSARRSNLNDALAWSAARWTVDQAVAAGAGVIYVEDLRSMEARGMGRTMNTRLSQAVRGQIVDRMRHLAAEVGIAVVTVPARNTSKHCPQCLTSLRHRKAPDRLTVAGWKWAICPNLNCQYQGDRDTGAWRRIAARGLTHQTKAVADRTSGTMVIRKVVDKLETLAVVTPTTKTSRKDRSKTGPTRPRTTRPAPRRRRAPSPSHPQGRAGQRPEGHAHTDRRQLPRAAHRHQGVNTSVKHTHQPHRPRGAALGAGFHLHAHASPPRWAEPTPDTTSCMGSLN